MPLGQSDYSDAIREATGALAVPGAFIMIPTETVYGLVCRWDDDEARENIYRAKGRDRNKLFQMLASDIGMIRGSGGIIEGIAEKAVKAFCPGPVTFVVPSVSGGSIGFRIPMHSFTLALIQELGKPLAATSANVSGEPPALNVGQITGKLSILPGLIVDGGDLPEDSRASTVAEITEAGIRIIREGAITLSDLQKAVLPK